MGFPAASRDVMIELLKLLELSATHREKAAGDTVGFGGPEAEVSGVEGEEPKTVTVAVTGSWAAFGRAVPFALLSKLLFLAASLNSPELRLKGILP
jgi:hypothetical protein